MSQAGTDSDSETEFVTEDVPILKRAANLKGRKQSLALAREKKVRNQKVVKNVMEVHKEINKAKILNERAATSMSKAKSRAAAEGIELPAINEVLPPAPAAPDHSAAILNMVQMMANEIKALRMPPAPVLPAPVLSEAAPTPPKPTRKRAPPKKKEPEETEPEYVPVNLIAPAPSANQIRMAEKESRIDALRKALGRK